MAHEPVTIHEAVDLPREMNQLVDLSTNEGFRFLYRLVSDWDAGMNRFSADGECFVVARSGPQLSAIGGLNQDPYAPSSSLGRLRHIYVVPESRRKGVGRVVVDHLLRRAQERFRAVRLRTDTRDAAKFYEALGFERLHDEPDATHVIRFRHSPAA